MRANLESHFYRIDFARDGDSACWLVMEIHGFGYMRHQRMFPNQDTAEKVAKAVIRRGFVDTAFWTQI